MKGRLTHDMEMISDDGESTRHGRSTKLEMPRSLLGSLSGSQDESRESMSVDDCQKEINESSVTVFFG